MNKNKGFTLIELLAVIVILAILMVVAVPKILNVIENSRKSAAESSIKLVKDAIKTQVASESMMGTNFTSDESGCYTFNFDDQTNGNAKELQLKNKENITGTIKYCNGNFTNNTLVFDGQDMKTIVCKRATKLHTEECTQTDSTYYCSGAGYTASGSKGTTTITYGNLGTNGALKSGDAFDCDVNGDGEYNQDTERFYYVSDYYNTNTNKFEDDTAVLIYYKSIGTSVYDDIGNGKSGPIKAYNMLPSESYWKNISLKKSSRYILDENGTKLNEFNYKNKTSRFLTFQELNKALGEVISDSDMSLIKRNGVYLLEETDFSKNNGLASYTLETFLSLNETIIDVWPKVGRLSNGPSKFIKVVRPAIEVPKSNIEY